MAKQDQFGFGTLRKTEWTGRWKSTAQDPELTATEWNEARESLHQWLGQMYLTDWRYGTRRHCWVDSGCSGDRTLQIKIVVPSLLDRSFLILAQQWLTAGHQEWRIAIPTGESDNSPILVYQRAVKINSEAEANLEAYLRRSRESLRCWIDTQRHQIWGAQSPAQFTAASS